MFMVYVVMAYVVMAYVVMAYVVMACVVMAYVVMAYVVMAYVVTAYVVMAYVVTAYIVMAYVVVARTPSEGLLRRLVQLLRLRRRHAVDPRAHNPPVPHRRRRRFRYVAITNMLP